MAPPRATAPAPARARCSVASCASSWPQRFPLLTTKKLHLKSIIYELLWFLRGETNVRWLQQHGVTIWDEWADENGELGPVYGSQWRHWRAADGRDIDQIAPGARRPAPQSRLAPPHRERVEPGGDRPHGAAALPCAVPVLRRRRTAVVPAVPAQRRPVPRRAVQHRLLRPADADGRAGDAGCSPANSCYTLGDAHLYLNHLEQAREQLAREPRPFPRMRLNAGVDDLFAFRYEDFALEGYDPYPAIRAPIAV